MFLFNSLSGEKEKFVAIGDIVKIYSCGPTVYGPPHIGNARAALTADFLRDVLVFLGYEVKLVSNFTDIDDKMINKAKERDIEVSELANEMSEVAKRSFGSLRISEPDERPWATKHIETIISMVKKLLKDGYAYEVKSDGIYFRVEKFSEYGKLSKQDLDSLNIGERVDENKGKENPRDFALWKYKKDGEPFWIDSDGEIKDGRPGWHIECSAMIKDTLGESIDIHVGGLDLKFPHNECEIAQSECVNNKKLANFWVHNGFLNMDGDKMSKSLGNIKSVIDLVKVYDPLDLRYFLMSVHYRSPLDFTDKNLKQASESRFRIQNLWDRFLDMNLNYVDEPVDYDEEVIDKFKEALSDDMNISKALAQVNEFITEVNADLDAGDLSDEELEIFRDTLLKMDQVLKVIRYEKDQLNEEQQRLFDRRVEARESKDYELSDKLRDELLSVGVQVLDGKDGTTYRLI